MSESPCHTDDGWAAKSKCTDIESPADLDAKAFLDVDDRSRTGEAYGRPGRARHACLISVAENGGHAPGSWQPWPLGERGAGSGKTSPLLQPRVQAPPLQHACTSSPVSIEGRGLWNAGLCTPYLRLSSTMRRQAAAPLSGTAHGQAGGHSPSWPQCRKPFPLSFPRRAAMFGAGVLGLPNALSWLGWVAGPALITIFFLTTVLSSRLLADVVEVNGVRHTTYRGVIQHHLVRAGCARRACCPGRPGRGGEGRPAQPGPGAGRVGRRSPGPGPCARVCSHGKIQGC